MSDNRLTLTLKGPQFTPELRESLNYAASRHGMTQAEFAAKVLNEGARKYRWEDPAPTSEQLILASLQEILRRLKSNDDPEADKAVQINVRAPEGSRDLFHRLAAAIRSDPELIAKLDSVLPGNQA